MGDVDGGPEWRIWVVVVHWDSGRCKFETLVINFLLSIFIEFIFYSIKWYTL